MKRVKGILWHVEPYEKMPWYLGVYRLDESRREWVLAPIGINLILRLAFAAWIFTHRPIRFFDAAFEADYWRDEYYGLKRRMDFLKRYKKWNDADKKVDQDYKDGSIR